MKMRGKFSSVAVLLLCMVVGGASTAAAQSRTRDPLAFLRQAITVAGTLSLTTAQETQLTNLITAYQNAIPDEPDAALEAARTAYRDAILAGNLAAAQAQATIIANRTAALISARLQAEAQFEIGVLAVLRTGGQLDALNQRFGTDRVLEIVDSLIGNGFPSFGNGKSGGGKRR